MKCAACGYEYRKEEVEVEEVVRYKMGKRKGEIKGSKTREIVFEVGDEPFKELVFKKDIDTLGFYNSTFIEVRFFMCPKCGTVRATDSRLE